MDMHLKFFSANELWGRFGALEKKQGSGGNMSQVQAAALEDAG